MVSFLDQARDGKPASDSINLVTQCKKHRFSCLLTGFSELAGTVPSLDDTKNFGARSMRLTRDAATISQIVIVA